MSGLSISMRGMPIEQQAVPSDSLLKTYRGGARPEQLVPMAYGVSRTVFADTAECGPAQGGEEAPAIVVNAVASFRH